MIACARPVSESKNLKNGMKNSTFWTIRRRKPLIYKELSQNYETRLSIKAFSI
jgi:hypothetical protein